MAQNFWLGGNELIIVYINGTHHVVEAYEDYNSVFTGDFKKCLEYCKNREIEYAESTLF